MQTWRPTRSAEITQQQIGDEMLLLDSKGKVVHVLNPTAIVIWQRCDSQHNAGQIAAILREQFVVSADEEAIQQDVVRILNLLHQKKLVI